MGSTHARLIGGYNRADFPSYDFAPDGWFLVIRGQAEAAAGTAPSMIVVPNWFEELKRLVPTKSRSPAKRAVRDYSSLVA